MKKLIALFVALFICGQAHAALVGTFGDKNSSGVYRVQVDDSGTVTYASDTSIVRPYRVAASSSVTTDTVAATDSGKVIVSTGGAAGGNMFVLPRATPGLIFLSS